MPIEILAVIPEPTIRWTLISIAFGLWGTSSCGTCTPSSRRCVSLLTHLTLPLPLLAPARFLTPFSGGRKATRLLIILIAALHAGVAISFKVLFFSRYIIAPAKRDALTPALSATVTAVLGAGVGKATSEGRGEFYHGEYYCDRELG
ncbi:hypothetical protein B0H14DRAFT_3517914 [Mycena olivaceomarginata]|nr:hypothetical protein B0H14DRAFT_3517914 [Mycena olivaceomarginata]